MLFKAFNSTSRYLDDLLNIDNPYFEQMISQICPAELQLTKASLSDTKAPFVDLDLSIMPRLHLLRSSYDVFVYDFSYDFFRRRRGLKATTNVFTLLTITLRFLRRQTRTKPHRDLADIV